MRHSSKLAVAASVLIACLLSLPSLASPAEDIESPEAEPQLFAVEIKSGPNWDESKSAYEQAYFQEHSANLKRLRSEGHIVMGARYSDIGLVIFSALSAEEVEAMMEQDPSMAAGTFVFEVHAFNMFYSFSNSVDE